MKKFKLIFICIILIIFILTLFVGCNRQLIDTHYKFDYAYIKVGEEWQNFKLKSWLDYEGEQIQLTLEDGETIIVSSINCILHNGKFLEEEAE